jgi:hypothetical protein
MSWDRVCVEHSVWLPEAKIAGWYKVVKIRSKAEHQMLPVEMDGVQGPIGVICWTVTILLGHSVKNNMNNEPWKLEVFGEGPTRSSAEDAAFLKLVF